MSAIVELFAAIIALILELTWHALVALYHGLLAAFSPRHRAQFLKEWRESTSRKILTCLLIFIGTTLVLTMAWFWTNVFFPKPEPKPQLDLARVLTQQERERLANTQELPDLASEAGKIAIEKLNSTWNFRPSKKETTEAPPPAAP